MAQRKNSVQLTHTAMQYLQHLVERGEFCSPDDAASYLITQAKSNAMLLPLTTRPPAASSLESLPQPETKLNLAEQFRAI